MPQATEGWANLDGENLPYYDTPDGQRRWLASKPVPDDHPSRNAESFRVYAARTGIPVMSLKDMKPFSRIWNTVPILDQDGKGACVGHAFCTAAMIANVLSGAPFTEFSAWFLYTNINGGWDRGANSGDAVESLTTDGICPKNFVPYATIRPAGYSDEARQQAKRFVIKSYVQISTLEEAVNAAYYGWTVCLDVQAGARFNTNSNGLVGYCGRWTNHEIFAGEEFKLINGTPVIRMRNSWSTQWGVQGTGYLNEDFFNAANSVYAMQYMGVDPQDPEMPPPLPQARRTNEIV